MTNQGRTVLLCDCEGSMPLDGRALAATCRGFDGQAATQLCRGQLGRFAEALGQDSALLVGCTQEAPLFDEQADEVGTSVDLRFVNIRERAGWSDEGAAATPKIAALLAEAALDLPPVAQIPLKSEGVALVYGRDERAIEAARQLADRLDVTVLLDRPAEILPPRRTDFPVLRGTVVRASGYLGRFELEVDDYATPAPSSRAALAWGPARRGAKSSCDLIIDLTGNPPLFPADHKRDGYLRVDPGNPAEVQRLLFRAADLVGEFEKPLYVSYRAELCAHSRSRKTGCTRCLEVCPTGAIAPAGDHVAIDPYVCAGCGSCGAVCPTGAATYALPPPDALLGRVRTLLSTYRAAGGRDAVLLFHDETHGDALIELLARHGSGLPARVIPVLVNSTTQIGVEVFASAFAYGASAARVLLPARRREDITALARQLGLAESVLSGLGFGSGRVGLIEADDPDALADALGPLPTGGAAEPRDFLPLGDKRGLARLAMRQLHEAAPTPVDVLPLASGAPFGRIQVDAEGCTLCLSCVPACPTGALTDNADRPQLSFVEDACVQCGICKNTCPEKVISLVPQIDFTDAARTPRVMKQEEPFHCIRCGKPFGTKSSVERVAAKLAGKHWMFQDSALVDRIKMCGDCRVVAQAQIELDPYAGPERPKPRTTDDYR
ncbi:4Fe-4S dicluster domain-containing protein [Arenibaculum pallidiluteum]|uniref:4Fe-4S dicluster domain-containing protein n=1 Tax=Arenibaculum pallidiluteum TaxID=2812559 RepID=UPI001A967B8F|nr:4Fe-4S dicluster domain-containing protein [Arenibaculum pallidiluteum]